MREAAHLLTAYHGAWTGIGKWLPRRLLSADPVRGKRCWTAIKLLAEHADHTPLATAAEEVLDLLGGPLRKGTHIAGAPDLRRTGCQLLVGEQHGRWTRCCSGFWTDLLRVIVLMETDSEPVEP